MAYFEAFAASVPVENKDAYRKAALTYGAMMKEYGALTTVDAWEDDVPDGKVTSFPMAVQRKSGEAVVAGYILWPSRAVRDEGKARAMQDPRMQTMDMPFDGKRMIFGGFEIIAES